MEIRSIVDLNDKSAIELVVEASLIVWKPKIDNVAVIQMLHKGEGGVCGQYIGYTVIEGIFDNRIDRYLNWLQLFGIGRVDCVFTVGIYVVLGMAITRTSVLALGITVVTLLVKTPYVIPAHWFTFGIFIYLIASHAINFLGANTKLAAWMAFAAAT